MTNNDPGAPRVKASTSVGPLSEFEVICDQSNNKPESIANNELHVEVSAPEQQPWYAWDGVADPDSMKQKLLALGISETFMESNHEWSAIGALRELRGLGRDLKAWERKAQLQHLRTGVKRRFNRRKKAARARTGRRS